MAWLADFSYRARPHTLPSVRKRPHGRIQRITTTVKSIQAESRITLNYPPWNRGSQIMTRQFKIILDRYTTLLLRIILPLRNFTVSFSFHSTLTFACFTCRHNQFRFFVTFFRYMYRLFCTFRQLIFKSIPITALFWKRLRSSKFFRKSHLAFSLYA